MSEQIYQFSYKIHDLNDMLEQDKALIYKAMEIREKAYAPYSSFWVGAAILLSNQQIITGNNQENAAYPSGLCAEITTPCGSCRQALLEYECTQGAPITVFCASSQGKVLEVSSIKELLPFCFELLYK